MTLFLWAILMLWLSFVLGLILLKLTQIKRILRPMEEKLDQANAELDQLDSDEQDEETLIRSAIALIVADSASLADLQAQNKALQDAAASGSAIMPSTVTALNTRINATILRIQGAAGTLQAALPPPPAPVTPAVAPSSGSTTIPVPDGTVTGGTAAAAPAQPDSAAQSGGSAPVSS